jgi:RNA polymerase sigma factor (sigma-70 family)
MAEQHRPVTPDEDGPVAWRRQYGAKVRRTFLRKLPPDAVAGMNEEFWAKVEEKRELIPAGKPAATRAYLLTMARSMIADYYEDRSRRDRQTAAARELARHATPPPDPTVSEAIRNEEGDRLKKYMALLPSEWRHALEMKYWAEKPKTQWSKEAGIDRKTAKEWEDKGERRLRELLGDDPPDELTA